MERLKTEPFAVILCDQRMPEMSGVEFLSLARSLRPLATRVLLTAFTDIIVLQEAINRAHVFRYLTKPWNNSDLIATIRQAVEFHELRVKNEGLLREISAANQHLRDKESELQKLNQNLEAEVKRRTDELIVLNGQLNELAMTDPLTHVLNRRAMFQKFGEELERCHRYKNDLSVAMVDVDHFKKFNDMEGHLAGDEALRKIAQLLVSNLRKTDVIARYGGEEFLVLMPETKVDYAMLTCERLRLEVERLPLQGKGQDAFLTISIGLASYPIHGKSSEELVRAADTALYEVKASGRNGVKRFAKENASFFVR